MYTKYILNINIIFSHNIITLYTFSIIYEMLNNDCNKYNNIFNLYKIFVLLVTLYLSLK